MLMTPSRSTLVFFCFTENYYELSYGISRQRELQETLRITNEFNDYVQNQIVSFEEWCNFIFIENDSSI